MEIFISYETTTGLSLASHVKKALEKVEKSAFVADEDIPKGTKWDNIVKDYINECKYFVVILTMGAILAPEQIKPEIELAHKMNKHIIPCKPHTINRMMTRSLPVIYELQQIDFADREDLAEQVIIEVMEKESRRVVAGAGEIELSNIQTAVVAMMVDNNLSALPNPVLLSTNNMTAFPDTSATAAGGTGDKDNDPNGNNYELADKDGYILYQHDIIGDGAQIGLVNYVTTPTTLKYYNVDAQGTVNQYDTAGL